MYEICVFKKSELQYLKPLQDVMHIGGSAECAICLPGLGNNIQAQIVVDHKGVWIKEINGQVYQNGKQIEGKVTLNIRDVFDINEYRLQLIQRERSDRAILDQTMTGSLHGEITFDDELPLLTFTEPKKKSFMQIQVKLGRGKQCDLVLPDTPETRKQVSREHAEIYFRNGSYYIRDLQSKNGTFLQDFIVDDRKLPIRGTLRLGRFELPYQIESETFSLEEQNDAVKIPSLNPELNSTMMIGSSLALQDLKDRLDKIIETDKTVLILGEMGSGKELAAKYLHFYHPKRKKQPFVVLNCAAIPEQLAESQLFGHVRGSFTGAVTDHNGAFRDAHKGTLFLDEVGELPPETQAKLLRVLEDGIVNPVGSNKNFSVNVRVLMATNRDIDEQRQKKAFRDDLFYRCQWKIRVPSLRERVEDISALISYFLQRSEAGVTVSPDVYRYLRDYTWPGNIRELSAAIDRAIVNAKYRGSEMIEIEDCDIDLIGNVKSSVIEELERKEIIKALEVHRGNVSKAAKSIKMPRKTMYRRLESFAINPRVYRG
ncbi:MAG: hypothetical protein COX62_08195 [Deltaproteobacteria bacterium CG_4_10_14_0_2_um_filter_43_8]|nr:MAG: hypothetical protein COV43_07875 [Deltaproteobacteria bacterium CG11_big_fil_rev_8_21_14_0_20_42_23]PJA18770.1 MAG: hypothetical protein COX62_08195 [Deltaproteobacteria bacterium CG_4_10_14_0_2_um_filter_43_8]PJC63910.1 MAG: hypothetical protein CO021_07030 [Deltaproteobacteria bacterium CG_4_9_14_0_2_um_filter_42_21]